MMEVAHGLRIRPRETLGEAEHVWRKAKGWWDNIIWVVNVLTFAVEGSGSVRRCFDEARVTGQQ